MPQYIAIDLKSFYASVECVERGLDPLTTNLVVADESRTEKTICLAVSPSLKKYGIPGRARLFEVVQKVKQVNRSRKTGEPELSYIAAPPRMALYVEYSTRIYDIYLKYVAPEDIHVYSIDEVFMDVTHYLKTYGMTAYQLAQTIILDVQDHIGITATAGIGTNLYLCKIAMDIVAKHIDADENGVRIAQRMKKVTVNCFGTTGRSRISGVSDRDMRRNWQKTECIPWEMWRAAPSEKKQIIIMKICFTNCLV